MARKYTTDELIASLKRRAAIPISQQTFTDQDLIDYLNDEMVSTIVPMLIDFREEFYVDYEDSVLQASQLNTIKIPDAAVGSMLRDVVLVHTAQNGEESFTNVPRLSLEQISSAYDTGSGSYGQFGLGFYIQGDYIKIYPATGTNDYVLRLYYYRRTPQLVLTNDAGMITAVDTVNNIVVVDNVPTTWNVGSRMDIIDGKPNFGIRDGDTSIVLIAGTNITFTDVSTYEIGDYVCNLGESVFPQIPYEAHSLLLQAAKIVILESLDDQSNMKLAVQKYDKMEQFFMKTVSPRVVGQTKKITTNNSIFQNNGNNWNY